MYICVLSGYGLSQSIEYSFFCKYEALCSISGETYTCTPHF